MIPPRLRDLAIQPRALTAVCIAALFALNAYIVHNLFHTEFTQETSSVDLAFMSFSRWLMDHWNDRSWFPLWDVGTPARQVYNPLLHHLVALVGRTFSWSAPHAYHFVTATTYCLGPITLFWLCYQGTKQHAFSFLTALLYSILSPSAFLVRAIRIDNGGLWGPRRLQTLVHYGEGPHVTALMWIPLVIWLLHEASVKRRWQFIPLASIGLACLVLTNWTGTTGLIMALGAFIAAKFGTKKIGEASLHWPTFIGIGILAYALASPWIPPSLIRTVQESAVGLDIVTPMKEKVVILAFAALVMLACHLVFQRRSIPSIYRFFVYLTLITGTAVLSKMWFGRVLVPIAHRFQLEMEIGLCALIAIAALAIATRLPKRLQYAALAVFLIAGFFQARYYRRESRNTTKTTDPTTVAQYPVSQWLAANMGNQRVFASGTIAIWMNLFSDVPQFFGCCDQSIRNSEFRGALYQIYSGEGAEANEGRVAELWLKLYGIRAIAIIDAPDLEQPYRNPKKFEGVLPVLWRDERSVVYQVPASDNGLAHVVHKSVLPTRHPYNGVDIEPITPLVNALDHPSSTTHFRWVNQHEAEITTTTATGEVIYLQQTCDSGWQAFEDSVEIPLACDLIGLTTINPPLAGPHIIRLVYSGNKEDFGTTLFQTFAVLTLAVWTAKERGTRKTHVAQS